MKCFIALFAVLSVGVLADPDHRPSYHPEPSYKPQHSSYKEPVYESTPPKYEYSYKVVDDYHGVNMGQNEARDGYSTYGEYHVQLPDGRLQTVKYNVADAYSGYVADVSYSGEPHYGPAPHKDSYKPEPKYYKPEPKYKPAPKIVYKPAPKYHS